MATDTRPPTVSFRVRGMRCASCTGAVEAALSAVPGVSRASVNLADETATVVLERAPAPGGREVEGLDETRPALFRAVRAAGYEPHDPAPPAVEDAQEARAARRELLLTLAAAIPGMALMALMLDPHVMHSSGALTAAFVIATLVQVGPGLAFHQGAVRALRAGRPNMDVLVSIGTTAAWALSSASFLGVPGLEGQIYFEASVLLTAFVRAGKWLEARARGAASSALRALLALEPATARRVSGGPVPSEASGGRGVEGAEETVPTAQVRAGDVLSVLAGERFPTDGEVVMGRTAADESMVTGESLPVEKGPGARVLGGSVNRSGAVRIRATAVGADSTLARIVRLVREAQADRAPIQRTVDRVAAVFVPAILLVGAATFAFWYFLGAARFGTPAGASPLAFSLALATAVIVVACPCALGLATPTAILVGSGVGLRRGILVKRASALEALASVDVMLLDKTGTLTQGAFEATDVVPAAGISGDDLLRIAGALEGRSTHPLARAIARRAAPLLAARPATVEDVEEEGGRGLAGVVDGERVRAGSRAFLSEGFVDLPAALLARADALAADARSVVWVARGGEAIGLVALADTPRPEAKDAIAALRTLGLDVVLVTGDGEAAARALARAVGIPESHIYAEARPEAKRDAVEGARRGSLQPEGFGEGFPLPGPRLGAGADATLTLGRGAMPSRRVAFAGDGVNDAPALAAADVGIAIGAGTDVAREAGDLVLVRSDLMDLPRAVRLARATLANVRRNLALAFVYNLAAVPLAAGALWPSLGIVLRPEWAGLAMALSSVSVVTSALLLRRIERRL